MKNPFTGLLTPENKAILVARSKSFAWRIGGWLVVTLIGFILQNLGLLNLSPTTITVVAFALNEVTKHVNDQLSVTN